jgi:hypothetical protein
MGLLTEEGRPAGLKAVVTCGYLQYLPLLHHRLYQWRVKLPGQPAVLTSIKAACLAEHFLDHQISLAITEAGQLVSAQISIPQTAESTCSTAKGLQSLLRLPKDLLSEPDSQKVFVKAAAAAPSVPKGPSGADSPDLSTAGDC